MNSVLRNKSVTPLYTYTSFVLKFLLPLCACASMCVLGEGVACHGVHMVLREQPVGLDSLFPPYLSLRVKLSSPNLAGWTFICWSSFLVLWEGLLLFIWKTEYHESHTDFELLVLLSPTSHVPGLQVCTAYAVPRMEARALSVCARQGLYPPCRHPLTELGISEKSCWWWIYYSAFTCYGFPKS